MWVMALRLPWLGCALFAVGIVLPIQASAAGRVRIVPGFHLVSAGTGVALFQKNREFVQFVEPQKNGYIRLLQGSSTMSGSTTVFRRRSVLAAWGSVRKTHRRPFSLLNGQFFNMEDGKYAPLAFSVKADGKLYAGYGDKQEFLGRKMMLVLGKKRHDIRPYADDPVSVHSLPGPNVIVGLARLPVHHHEPEASADGVEPHGGARVTRGREGR